MKNNLKSDQIPNLPWRERFFISEPDLVYLDGNSLGRLPLATIERLEKVIQTEWGNGLIRSWNNHWLNLPERIGEKIGQIIGAQTGETLIADSTSVNLFKLASSIIELNPSRNEIITDSNNFPSDRFILGGLSNYSKVQPVVKEIDLFFPDPENPLEALTMALNKKTGIVVLSHVDYKSGFAFHLPEITKRVQEAGARLLLDLSHSAGVMDINFADTGADAAVGCTYKYLNGGPGSPAFLVVKKELVAKLENPIRGWFGAENPFDFDAEFKPNPGVGRFRVGTPSVLSLAAVEPGVDLVLEAGIQNLRNRSVVLSERFLQLFDRKLESLGYQLNTPRVINSRGSHISLAHEYGWQITQDLIRNHSVIVDFRTPNFIRFGFSPLYNDESDIDRAISALESSVNNQSYLEFPRDIAGVP